MLITKMKCNHLTNPLGFKMDHTVLSWITQTAAADFQDAAQIEVATDPSFDNLVFESGKDHEIDSLCFKLPLDLMPCTRYYWRVTVWAGSEQALSETAWFETAKMDQPWQASWIASADMTDINPVFRKAFQVSDKSIASARVYASAAGVYELEINGRKAGNEFLAPFCNQYSEWMQYQTYDVTDLLISGNNRIGTLVGPGWYRGRFGLNGGMANRYGDKTGFICELVIRYDDGSSDLISSDSSWQTAPSFITDAGIYDGETQDANLKITGWSGPAGLSKTEGGRTVDWQQATVLDLDKNLLTARLSIPVVIKETMKPVQVIQTPAGETVLDMGQNMVGGFSLEVDLPAGQELVLKFGEILQHGNFYQENLRTAKQTFTYRSSGNSTVIRPYFTFFGYRYVRVDGWPGDPKDLKVRYTGTVIYSDMERTGFLETSNPKINRLYANALWGQKGNFLDVPTDCPQRDERMGWTGDAQVFCATATFNMDTYAFYRKYLFDMAKDQALNGGKVPVVVPCMYQSRDQSSAWADATAIIPWTSYLFSGDASILAEHYPAIKAYVESIRAEDTQKKNMWTPVFSYGDWLAQDGRDQFSYFGGTPNDLISTAYYCYSTTILAKAATVLGYQEDADHYHQLAEAIRTAYQKEFITETGRLAVNTQTAAVVSLFMELASAKDQNRISEHLFELLKTNNFYLKTGFVGTPYICRVLSDHGYNDVAYRLLLNEGLPSWLYCVNMGATTIWERWNSVMPDGLLGELGMNSLNHYAYGSIAEWMYRNIGGIQPLEKSPGFRQVRLAPQPDCRLKKARVRYDSPIGTYETAWEIRDNGGLWFEVTVPFGGEAELVLPDSGLENKILTRGKYQFEYKPKRSYKYHYSTFTHTIVQLMAHPEIAAIAEEIMPGITFLINKNNMSGYRQGLFRDLIGVIMFKYTEKELDALDERIYDIPIQVL